MKQIFGVLLTLILLTACQSVDEKRKDSIKDILSKKGVSNSMIEFLSEDSLMIPLLDSEVMELSIVVLGKINDSQNSIDEFINFLQEDTTNEDSSKRIWLKTMTPQQNLAYHKILNEEKETGSLWELLGKKIMWKATNSFKDSPTIITVEYTDNHLLDSTKKMRGIFYFNDTNRVSVISKYYILTLQEYNQAVGVSIAASKNNSNILPKLDNLGYDIVPIDEDPTKTKEERVEIKRIQREKELAEEQRQRDLAEAQRQKELAEAQHKREEEEKKRLKQIDNKIIKDIKTFISYWNQGCPTQVDEVTIGVNAIFRSNKIYYNYKLLVNKGDLSSSQWENIKSTMERNLKSECQNILQYFVNDQKLSIYEIKQAFKRIGLSWSYTYKDIYGRTLFSVIITPEDLD